MARHHAARTAPRGGPADLTGKRIAALAAAGAAALAAAGCGSSVPSACRPPAAPPTIVSGDDRRSPVVANDGAGGAVVAWESLAGRGVEAVARDRASAGWGVPNTISAAAARDVDVAMDPAGEAIAAWQRQPVGGVERIEVAARPAGGAWSAPTAISADGSGARQPVVDMDGRGRAIVAWRRDTGGQNAVIEIAERGVDGRWSPPRALSEPDRRARRPRLAVAPGGAAVVVWEERVAGVAAVGAATRTSDGIWSHAAVISGGIAKAHEPDVAIGASGDATAVWIAGDDGGAGAFAVTSRGDGSWDLPQRIASGDAPPHEVSRPGRAGTGADVAVLPDGRAVAAWTLFEGGADVVASAIRTDGAWGPPRRVSRADAGGGVQVAALAGGGALLAWEELAGGLIRARAARVAGGPAGCVDLSTARSETGGVQVAGGAVPVVAFLDLNRGRVAVATSP